MDHDPQQAVSELPRPIPSPLQPTLRSVTAAPGIAGRPGARGPPAMATRIPPGLQAKMAAVSIESIEMNGVN